MNLLMITRKVDYQDASPAGFTYTWVKKIGEKLDKLYVITWQKSDQGDLPDNIEIISLPENKVKKVFVLQKELLRILSKLEGVFCHQNPEYTILSAPLAKLFRKKIVSWYTHKEVSWKLHLVNLLTDRILTASKESCRLKNRKKIEVVGHGIDVEKFKSQKSRQRRGSLASLCRRSGLEAAKVKITVQKSKFIILSLGRLSISKDYETLIKAIEILIKKDKKDNLEARIVGGPVLKSEQEYFGSLKQLIKDRNLENYIKFLGPVAHNQIVPYYQNCDLFINLSQTGSLDKAVLEAMATETIALTSNEAFVDILKDERLLFEPKNPKDLADKIINLINLSQEEKENIGQRLRAIVVKNHNLDNLTDLLYNNFRMIK